MLAFFSPDSVLEDVNRILNFIIMIGSNTGKLSSLSLDLLPACSRLTSAIYHKELKHHSDGFGRLWKNRPSYPAFLSTFSSPQAPFPRNSECFQEIWHRCVSVSSMFWRKLVQIWLDPEVRGPVMPTKAFSEKNLGFREWTPAWNHHTRKQRRLMKVKWHILQNWFCTGLFTGWKGLWHITSGGQIGKCSQCWYQKCWLLPLMLASTISLTVGLRPGIFKNQHDLSWILLTFLSSSLVRKLANPCFSWLENQVSSLVLYVQQNEHTVLNTACGILKLRCMLGLVWKGG